MSEETIINGGGKIPSKASLFTSKKYLIGLAVLVLLIAAYFIFSSDGTKVAYCNSVAVAQAMPETKTAQQQLNDYQKTLNATIDNQKASLNKEVQNFYKDSASMPLSMRDNMKTILQTKVKDFETLNQTSQNSFDQKRLELSTPIQAKLQKAIEVIAKEKGFTYVVIPDAVLYAPPSSDITAAVKKKLGLQ